MAERVYVTQPIAASALKRLREVARATMNQDSSHPLPKKNLIAAVKKADILFSLLHDRVDRDVLVTKVAGPSLSYVLPRVAGVVAELGGSTSHLASLARERGIPMVLGVLDATRHIPDGVQVAVDGVAGVVRWVR